eukprot:COSAG01_NODE_102_length_26290_cov_94.760299_5_plen_1064_part_00
MAPEYVPDGWLATLVRGQAWHNCSSHALILSAADVISADLVQRSLPLHSLIDIDTQEAIQTILRGLGSAHSRERLQASRKLHDSTAWLQGPEAHRGFREAAGTLGGVGVIVGLIKRERVSASGRQLTAGGDEISERECVQHWDTLAALCLCPQNAANAARWGAMAIARQIMEEHASADLQATVLLMLSNFAGFCWSRTASAITEAGLLPFMIDAATAHIGVDGSEDEPWDGCSWSITALQALARCTEIHQSLVAEGLPKVFALMLQTESVRLGLGAKRPSDTYLKASFGLVSLMDGEENHPAIARDLDRCIGWMVESLRASLDGGAWPQQRKQLLWVTTHGIASLAVPEANKNALGKAGVIPLLVKVLCLHCDVINEPETGRSLSVSQAWSLENATSAIWALSFTEENKVRMLEQRSELRAALQGMSELSEMQVRHDHESQYVAVAALRRATIDAGYLMWALQLTGETGVDFTSSPDRGRIAVVHHEDDAELAMRLRQGLADAGYDVMLTDSDGSNHSAGENTSASLHFRTVSTADARGQQKVLDENDYSKTIFVSHCRRDPPIANMCYCILQALRFGVDDANQPLCAITNVDANSKGAKMHFWTDKEQLAQMPGVDFLAELTKAQLKSRSSWFMIGNAYAGSGQCMAELQYANSKKLQILPIFIERYAQSEAEFSTWQHTCDPDLADFEHWKLQTEMIDRIACSKQGAVHYLDREDFVCDACRNSRGLICENCSNWERAKQTSSGKLLLTLVQELSVYLQQEWIMLRGVDVDNVMLEASKASCVVMLANSQFKLSHSCRTEVQHAHSLDKPLITLLTEEHWTPDGWLEQMIPQGTTAHPAGIPLVDRDADFEGALAALIAELGDLGIPVQRQSTALSQRRRRLSRHCSSSLKSNADANHAGKRASSSSAPMKRRLGRHHHHTAVLPALERAVSYDSGTLRATEPAGRMFRSWDLTLLEDASDGPIPGTPKPVHTQDTSSMDRVPQAAAVAPAVDASTAPPSAIESRSVLPQQAVSSVELPSFTSSQVVDVLKHCVRDCGGCVAALHCVRTRSILTEIYLCDA